MRTDDGRTIIVVAQGPHLSAAVRERVPREVALVRWADTERLADAWERCRPWPWIVIGAGQPPDTLSSLLADRPVVTAWLRRPGVELPPRWIALEGWEGLTGWLRRLCRVRVGGLGLAPHRGVRAGPSGTPVPAPSLEALLAAHPRGVAMCATMRGARSTLRRLEVPCTLQVSGGEIRLAGGLPLNTPYGGECR